LLFALTICQPKAVDALGDIIHADAGRVVRKVMGQNNNMESFESNTGDKSLGEERTMELRDHEKVHGFPSSIVPTMEEKVVTDALDSIPEDGGSCEEGDTDKLQNGNAQVSRENSASVKSESQDVKPNGDTQELEAKGGHSDVKTSGSTTSLKNHSTSSTNVEARVDTGELYGAPANASRNPKTDDQPPHAASGKNDATETEEKAVHARAEIRKHLSTKSNPKVWTLPTPTPKVDPHGFEDPISDDFWKRVWMACAVHNVGPGLE
jgi:phospholipase D1/2